LRGMRDQKEAERRVKILDFWKEHGLEATQDAFDVSRRTLYRWQAVLQKTQGQLQALDRKSTAPKKRRCRIYPSGLIDRIIELRTAHYRYGKKKLAATLNKEGYIISVSYCGRVLADLQKQGRLPSGKKLSYYAKSGKHIEHTPIRHTKNRRKEKRGIEIDTVVRFVDGTKRYILTAIDVTRKFTFAAAYTSHSSKAAADFLGKLIVVAPFPITEVQSDNGSEFALLFREACEKLGIVQYHTYPRSPKMNACIERFNRTLSEDFIVWHRALLRDDLCAFNEALVDWLLWYNTERPHESLGMRSPLEYIVRTLSAAECQKYWTRTSI
jgi:transposase InsO family protein